MVEIDFLPVGDGRDSGDAIAARFTRPDTGADAVIVVDAGFKDDGEALVGHIKDYYATDKVDLAILTHPDGDHIGGMGEVVRGLNVERLWLHDLGARGGASLPAADAVDDLMSVAAENGTMVEEPWAGQQWFGGALTILGPSVNYYDELVSEQVSLSVAKSGGAGSLLLETARNVYERVAGALPLEIPFEAKDVSPRNNSSIITMLVVDGRRYLLTADAGVPALDRAWDQAEAMGLGGSLRFVQVPHHGSRRNASSAWLNRILGEPGSASDVTAFVSVVPDSPKHPSARVVNAYLRRGAEVFPTAGSAKWHHTSDAPYRGWGPATPLGPMDEAGED